MSGDFTPEEKEDIKNRLEDLSGKDRQNVEDSIFEEYEGKIDGKKIDELLDSVEEEDPEIEIDKKINPVLGDNYKYGTANLKRKHFKGFNKDRIVLKSNVTSETLENLKSTMAIFKETDKNNEEIYNQLIEVTEEFLSGYREEEIPKDFIDMAKEVEDFDLKLITERERFYSYWEGINEQFDILLEAIDTFKEVAESDSGLNKEIKDKIENLPDPANYVINVKSYNINMEHPKLRILKYFSQLGVIEDRKVERERHEPNMGISGTDLDQSIKGFIQGKVDPVLHYALEDMEIPIALDEADVIPEILKRLSEKEGISEQNKRQLLKVIEIINRQASDSFETVKEIKGQWEVIEQDNYVPISPFIEKHATEMKVTEIQGISKKTSNFLGALQEILLEEHTLFPIYQKPVQLDSGADFRAILPKINQGVQGTSDSRLDRARQQSAKLPKERKLGSAKKFKDARIKLIKALNTYYFLPLSGKGKFLDAPPRFSYQSGEWATIPKGEGKEIISRRKGKGKIIETVEGREVIREGERQHRKTQMAGSHALRSLKFAFSTSPANVAEKKNFLHFEENIDEEFIEAMKTYFTKMNQKVTFDESLYRLFENTVNQLNKVIPNTKKNNETYFGNKLYEYAIEMEKNTDELQPFMGSDINTHHRKYERGQNSGTYYPMAELRSLLEEDTLRQHIKRDKEYMGSNLGEKIDDLLDLMNPRDIEKEDRINIKLLEAHDSIRKMQGKELYIYLFSSYI